MSFKTPLVVEQLEDTSHDGRGTWQLQQPLVYESEQNGVITVPMGFVTDFASVPRLPVAYLLAGDTAHPAAVVHDWLYTSHQVERSVADNILKEAAISVGVPTWRATIMYMGVRAGGFHAWDEPGPIQPDNVKIILEKVYEDHRPLDDKSAS